MDAVEGIEKGKSPEANQGKSVAPDRLLEHDRDEVIHESPTQRRDEESDKVVDEESTDRPGTRSRHVVLGHQVTHRIRQERPDKGRHEVPHRDI